MRLSELAVPTKFYHGSSQQLQVGKSYRVRRGPKSLNTDSSVEQYLEHHRPKNAIPRNRALFMTSKKSANHLMDIGASDEYVYVVEPLGRYEMHDVQWINDIDSIMKKEKGWFSDTGSSYSWHMPPITNDEIEPTMEMLAKNYWEGKLYPFSKWRLPEYLTSSFRVVDLVKGPRKSR